MQNGRKNGIGQLGLKLEVDVTTSGANEEQLQQRVADLESQLRRERRRRQDPGSGFHREVYDNYGDVVERKADELASFVRGFIRAGLEGFRVAADSASEAL